MIIISLKLKLKGCVWFSSDFRQFRPPPFQACMADINEWKYVISIQLHISLVNNVRVWSSNTIRMICMFDIRLVSLVEERGLLS